MGAKGGQQLVGGLVGVQKPGVAPPPPPWLYLSPVLAGPGRGDVATCRLNKLIQ